MRVFTAKSQQKELSNINSNLSTYILDLGSNYSVQSPDKVEIIYNDRKIYVPQSLGRRVLYWYHFYINHPGGSRFAKTIRGVCYLKGLVTPAELFSMTCNICQQFKNRMTLYGHLPPKNISELKLWYTVHVDLIGPYSM